MLLRGALGVNSWIYGVSGTSAVGVGMVGDSLGSSWTCGVLAGFGVVGVGGGIGFWVVGGVGSGSVGGGIFWVAGSIGIGGVL